MNIRCGWCPCETPLERLPAAVIDLETTGLRAWDGDRVIEIGAVPVDGLEIAHQRALDALVDPGRPVSDAAFHVHGIADARLRGQPSFAEVLPLLARLLDGRTVVGHNVGFDINFLRMEIRRLGATPHPQPLLDTEMLARAAFPDRARGCGLDRLLTLVDVPSDGFQRHRALGDARLTALVYVRLLRRLLDEGVRTLFDLQGRCAQLARRTARGRKLESALLDAVLEALRSGRQLGITYVSPRSGSSDGPVVTRRTVVPVGLRGLWLDAMCYLRDDLRTFRLDRIRDYELQQDTSPST